MAMNIVTGNDAGTALSGTAGGDLIYGFDPNAAYASATITATRVVGSGLSLPIAVTSAPGDLNRLFVVEKYGTIKIVDLNSGEVLATPFLTVPVDNTFERGLLGLAFDPNYASNGLFYVYRTSPTLKMKCSATRCRPIPTWRTGPASWCSTSGPPPTATTMPDGSDSDRTVISTSIPATPVSRPTRRT